MQAKQRNDKLFSYQSMTRREFCRALLGGGLGLAFGNVFAKTNDNPPNILFITTDDLGPTLGCYGDAQAKTPHIDRLAEQSVLFVNAYVTQASCSPSRSSMFTGLYPHQNGQIGLSHRGYTMHEGMKSLPMLLKKGGYRTGVLGKVHVAPSTAVPFDYQSNREDLANTRDVTRIAELANQFMASSQDGPFFLMVNYGDPHRPLLPQVKGIPERPYRGEDTDPFPFLGVDTPKVREEVAGYYSCVSRIDTGMGLLLQRLSELGHEQDTVVLFIGDHGPPFTRSKTTCYEAGVRIPFLLRVPGMKHAGKMEASLVSTVDILPTFLEAAGIALPEGLAGQSLWPLLEGGPNISWRETLCCEYTSHHQKGYFPRRSIRDNRYKLILNLLPDRPNPILAVDGCAAWKAAQNPSFLRPDAQEAMKTYAHPPTVELYDLKEDPEEFHNLAGRDSHESIEKRLLKALQAWREETNDPLLDAEQLRELTLQHTEGA